MTERKHQPLEELDLVAFETDAQDAIDQWDGKMDAEAVLRLVAEVRRLQKLAAHWEEQRDCAAEEVEGWIATANQRGEEVRRLEGEVYQLRAKLKTAEDDEADLEAKLDRYRTHLIAIRKIAEGDV